MTFLLKNCSKLPKSFLKVNLLTSHQLPQQNIKAVDVVFYSNKQDAIAKHQKADATKPPKKHKESPKITLFQNENMTVTALEDAKRLAKSRSLHLVKVQDMDHKTQRPIYKLLTAAEMLENELAEAIAPPTDNKTSSGAAVKKAAKSLSIGSRIGEHDFESRLKNISKWITKQHEVRILIQATSEQDLANAEKIFKTIEDTIKKPQVIGKIVQKRTKSNLIKFSILPIAPANQNKPADGSNQ